MTPRQLNLLSLAVLLVVLALSWAAMPSGRIAVHFGAGGEPDSWGTRTELVGVVGSIVVAAWLFVAWLSHASDRLHWSMVNIPRKEFWSRPENEAVARERLAVDMALVNGWMIALVVAICPAMVLATRRGEMSGALGWYVVGVIALLCVVLTVVILRRNRFYRDVPEA
ncbi:DUF1648 domain-containing protein [Nocardioides daphniae]|uniref:DUF1648 domain-containing protein n=1 Tax=Nocardioides daphniae TaxID=402297 RepID=A0ABQ1QB45_9ACTN|nr:DUF1648 domain-containing protein [Nocardioides daphniae]GGD21133.1 hypothetical protein GCM10007231_20350 [Nocardioides daphniae]